MTDWLSAFEESLAAFEPAGHDRSALGLAAAGWAERARDEHASIAAFDRFSLALLAVAAPPELLEGAHVAALDEIRHSRLAFALASTYAGAPIGPGPLDVDRALDEVGSLAQLAEATLIEGCIGETLAAIEAEWAAEAATEPAARAALQIISADEARHAELAWATVRWASAEDPALTERLGAVFEEQLARAVAFAETDCSSVDLTAFGLLRPDRRMALRRAAARDILEPAARVAFG